MRLWLSICVHLTNQRISLNLESAGYIIAFAAFFFLLLSFFKLIVRLFDLVGSKEGILSYDKKKSFIIRHNFFAFTQPRSPRKKKLCLITKHTFCSFISSHKSLHCRQRFWMFLESLIGKYFSHNFQNVFFLLSSLFSLLLSLIYCWPRDVWWKLKSFERSHSQKRTLWRIEIYCGRRGEAKSEREKHRKKVNPKFNSYKQRRKMKNEK